MGSIVIFGLAILARIITQKKAKALLVVRNLIYKCCWFTLQAIWQQAKVDTKAATVVV